MKRMIVVMLLMLVVGSAQAYQLFTTPDNAFQGALNDGTITTKVLGNGSTMWQVPGTTLSIAMIETVNISNAAELAKTDEQEYEAVRNAAISADKTAQLLSDAVGTYNGFKGDQFSFRVLNEHNVWVLATIRQWRSNTGHTFYVYCVYEQESVHDQANVNLWLNSVVLH